MEFFIRHTRILEISDLNIHSLYDRDLIGIHFQSNYKVHRDELLLPESYDNKYAIRSIKYLHELSSVGGYIWCDYSPVTNSIIGWVKPGTKIELIDFAVVRNHADFIDGKLIMKCLKLEKKIEVKPEQLLSLKARRPQLCTFVKWHKSYGKIENQFTGNTSINERHDLTPDQLEILVYEYLRLNSKIKGHIQHILMPIGRTMKDIDIYGLNKKGEKVFVQVTYDSEEKWKINALKKFKGFNNILIYAGDVDEKEEDGVIFINIDNIYCWLKKHSNLISYFD